MTTTERKQLIVLKALHASIPIQLSHGQGDSRAYPRFKSGAGIEDDPAFITVELNNESTILGVRRVRENTATGAKSEILLGVSLELDTFLRACANMAEEDVVVLAAALKEISDE